MSELMCSQSKCRRKDEHIAELEDDNRKLSEIEQRRIGEAITQADSIAELREQLAKLREALVQYRVAMEFTRQYVGYEALPPIKGWSWYDADENAKAALQDIGNE